MTMMQEPAFSRHSGERGVTMVEVVVAMIILATAVFGAVACISNGRIFVERAAQQRAAAHVALARIEAVRTLDAPADDSGTVTLDGTTFSWTLDVTSLTSDPADENSLYRQLSVTVSWSNDGNNPVLITSAMQ